jgi:hypothetical protein
VAAAARWLSALALLVAALCVLAFVLFTSSGGLDCGDACTSWDEATGAAFVWLAFATVVLVPVAIAATIVARVAERRRRR